MSKKLSEKQIENWRRMLCADFGPYAFIMPVEELERIVDKFQAKLDRLCREERK